MHGHPTEIRQKQQIPSQSNLVEAKNSLMKYFIGEFQRELEEKKAQQEKHERKMTSRR